MLLNYDRNILDSYDIQNLILNWTDNLMANAEFHKKVDFTIQIVFYISLTLADMAHSQAVIFTHTVMWRIISAIPKCILQI